MMLKVVVVAVLVVGTVNAVNYCSVCADHTMCVYLGVASSCEKVLTREFSDAARNEIVAKHNELRNRVALGLETQGGGQPAAANMKKLTWSAELAQIAQRWTDQCNYGHDKCRNTEAYGWVGQNAYIRYGSQCSSWKSDPLGNSATQSWYNEVKYFNKNNIEPYESISGTGHYTQVAWAETALIGCGYTSYQKGNTCHNFIACNYAPGGNVEGANTPMYKRGTARSACPNAAKDNAYPGLCA